VADEADVQQIYSKFTSIVLLRGDENFTSTLLGPPT